MTEPKRIDVSREKFLKRTFKADAIEQYGRRDYVRRLAVIEQSAEDVYQKLVDVAQKSGVALAKEDISVYHAIPNGKLGPRTSTKFMRRYTKQSIMASKDLKRNREKIYIIDNATAPTA